MMTPDPLEVLRMYEQWEADLIMCDKSWDTYDGLPKLTQELYDRLMEIQAQRNLVLHGSALGGVLKP